MLIVELVTLWFALSVAVGVPLGSRIRRADAAEFPLRQETEWWFTTTASPDDAEIPSWALAERPVLRELPPSPFADHRPLAEAPALR
jgi:hypothetical protein